MGIFGGLWVGDAALVEEDAELYRFGDFGGRCRGAVSHRIVTGSVNTRERRCSSTRIADAHAF